MVQLLFLDTLLKPSINFNDIENMIAVFNNSSHQNIQNWIDNFEDIIPMLNLSDELIFVKQCLTGKEQLFLLSELKVNSWDKLKTLLTSECCLTYNSAEIHEFFLLFFLRGGGRGE